MKTLLILLFFLVGNIHVVNPQIREEKIHFPYNESLSARVYKTVDKVYGKTPGLVVSDGYVIILRSFIQPLFEIFDTNNCNYIGGCGLLGKGPKDFIRPDARTGVASINGFKVFDLYKGCAFIDLNKYLSDGSWQVRYMKLPGELYMLNDAIQLNDSLIVGMPYAGKTNKMNVMFNTKTQRLFYFGEYPEIFSKSTRDLWWGAFWRHSAAKPDGTAFVSFFDEIKMFRIYDNRGKLKTERIMSAPNLFDGKIFKKHNIVFYKRVRVTDSYIYALCMNRKLNIPPDTYPTLEIWDWDGNPVAEFRLDHNITTFDIYKNGIGIFGMDDEVSNEIYYYDIKFY